MARTHSALALFAWAAAWSAGCSPSATDNPAGAGGLGPTSSGGVSGSTASGGAIGSGGVVGLGGSSGGSIGSGGVPSSTGGASGAVGFGGVGATQSGGATTFGGVSGAVGSGGASGSVSSGGTAGSGGQALGGAGGGGKSGAGGSGSGGAATGGSAGKSGSGGMSGAGTGGSVGAGGAASKSTGCGKAPGIASSMYNGGQLISITAANLQRRYILNVPTNYDNTKPYKLIIAFHQLDGNDKQMYANGYYHLLDLSKNNAIFVAPNGQKNGAPCTTTGNGDGGCGWPNPSGSDVALADAVVAQVKDNFCIDNNRIFATGWSYGGSMSYKTACERGLGGTKGGVAGYIRGIAVYSGAQLSGTCTPTTPVAYYGSHGTSDNVLGYDGGVGLAHNFATPAGCTWATPAKATGNHICTDLAGCMPSYPVKFCSFVGGHTPDPTEGGQRSWQYQLVWDFLNQF